MSSLVDDLPECLIVRQDGIARQSRTDATHRRLTLGTGADTARRLAVALDAAVVNPIGGRRVFPDTTRLSR